MYSPVISCVRKNGNSLKNSFRYDFKRFFKTLFSFAISPPRVAKKTHYVQDTLWLMGKYKLVIQKNKIHLRYHNFSYF
jgi:hypothetical protein